MGWCQEVPLSWKVASLTAKQEDTKITRVRGPKLFCVPLLQPDSCSMSSPDCTQCTKSFQPDLRQCLPGKPPAGPEEATEARASPKQAAESNTNSQAVSSSLPREPISSPTFSSSDGVWLLGVPLPWEETEGNKCIGKDPPAMCTLEMPCGREKRKIPQPAHSSRMVQPPVAAALPCFIPVPSTQT